MFNIAPFMTLRTFSFKVREIYNKLVTVPRHFTVVSLKASQILIEDGSILEWPPLYFKIDVLLSKLTSVSNQSYCIIIINLCAHELPKDFWDMWKNTFITSMGLDANAPANPAMILDLYNQKKNEKMRWEWEQFRF